MCHLIFLVPLAGIPLFWILPWGYALLINILLWIVFGSLGYKIIKAMMLPAYGGIRGLVGSQVEVISKTVFGSYSQYLVKVGGELWTARSPENLVPGDKASVEDLDGIKLVVTRALKEVRVNERHCH
jgi:membrane protein implicated in regulation of membrane protease activity